MSDLTKRLLKYTALALGLWLAWSIGDTFLASEDTQMLRMQDKFLRAVEKGKWSTVDALISEDYTDAWGHNAATVRHDVKEVFQGFFFLKIEQKVTEQRTIKGLGFLKANIQLQGTGAGISSIVLSRANQIKEPWVFHWHKRGRWPWSWELVEVFNGSLR